MGTPNPHELEEFCIECSNFVEALNEYTGWCDPCSIKVGWIAPSCISCGESLSDPSQKLCYRCKHEKWFERNADAIDTTMAVQGLSARAAIKFVRENNRPICRSCGKRIKGGQKGRHYFCTKRPECVKAHTAYSYHIRHKPHNEALELAITASVIYKLTANINPNT